MAFDDIEPIDSGDLENPEVGEPPVIKRQRKCNPEVRAFMSRALRSLETQPDNSTLEVPIERFKAIGLENPQFIEESLEACPESMYVKPELIDGKIKLTKLAEPEIRPVKHYYPRRFGQEED